MGEQHLFGDSIDWGPRGEGRDAGVQARGGRQEYRPSRPDEKQLFVFN